MSYESSPRSAESTHALDYKKGPVDRMIDPFRKSFQWLLAERAGPIRRVEPIVPIQPTENPPNPERKPFLPMPATPPEPEPSPPMEPDRFIPSQPPVPGPYKKPLPKEQPEEPKQLAV